MSIINKVNFVQHPFIECQDIILTYRMINQTDNVYKTGHIIQRIHCSHNTINYSYVLNHTESGNTIYELK